MVMLAKKYEGQNPTGWWMSEKLDGVRAVWNGFKLVSRTGKPFAVPEWFIKDLPVDLYLDGELWEGRGLFSQTCGKVRKQINPDWSGIKFMVFDCICEGTIAERYRKLHEAVLPAHVQILNQTICSNRKHLDEFEAEILKAGGEGVMIRRPLSLYENTRSSSLLKVKRFQTDEAVVEDYEAGQGKHLGRVGALLCRFRDKLISIGTGLTDKDRECPPEKGSLITFSFFELTDNGMPRFPVYIAERNYE